MVVDAACTIHMPMLDQEGQNIKVNTGTEIGKREEEESTKAAHDLARPKTGGGGIAKRLSDGSSNEGAVEERLCVEGNMETTPCKAADMKGMGKEKNKQASVKKKTHKNRAGKVQETNRKRSDNGGGKKRYKALALAVKRHQEMSEERMKKQDLLFASVSKNLDQIDLLLGRMD